MKTILLISPYWREKHRWMVSSYKLAELWQRLGYRVVVVCMGKAVEERKGEKEKRRKGERDDSVKALSSKLEASAEVISDTLTIYRKPDYFLKDPWNYGIAFGFTEFVREIIKEEKPDHIVVNKVLFWTSLSLIPLGLSGRKITLLTDALVGMTWWPRSTLAKICAAIYAWTAGWLILCLAHRIVFFHPQPERLLRKLLIKQKSSVIPTGIDATSYSSAGSEQAQLRATSNNVDSPKPEARSLTVTYVGRLESVKGVDDFLAAVSLLTDDYKNLKVQVAGHYEEDNALVDQFQNKVHFLGLSNDVPGLLSTTDIFVLPSYSEGLSNALMEAMASSCACIASDVGGNRFLIQNGVSGLLFPAGDREALKSHLRRLIEDDAKREALGKEARARIEKEFSWEVVGRRYRELFKGEALKEL